MEIEHFRESKRRKTGSSINELYPVSGLGLPYAPENFPNPGDKWGWKVGKRIGATGYYVDRYLYLPTHLQKEHKSQGFRSKDSVKQFLSEAFPDMDIKAFFASFSWKIPSGNNKGNKEPISLHQKCNPQFNVTGCKAGNVMCSSSLKTCEPMPCDTCCIDPRFCRDCCCILCCGTIDSEYGSQIFIRCEAKSKDGYVCGHVAHIECALCCSMAGTGGGSTDLAATYHCRRCDGRTNLVPHVVNLLESHESNPSVDENHKILSICLLLLRGSTSKRAKKLLRHVQSAMGKLKGGISHEDISAVTTGDVSPCEADTLEVSNVKELSTKFDYKVESLGVEARVEKTLLALKKSQEAEYKLAHDILTAQKKRLLSLHSALDKEKGQTDTSDKMKTEFANMADMGTVAKGFGKTSAGILERHFGIRADDRD